VFLSDAGIPDGGSGTYPALLPWGLTTVDCNAYALLLNHQASLRDSAELVTFSSDGTRLGAVTLGNSDNDTGDQGAYRLASYGHTLVVTYPTRDGGGQLVMFDVNDAGPTEVKRVSVPFTPQAVALSLNRAHIFGRSGAQFAYSQGVLDSSPILIAPLAVTSCPNVMVERAVYSPDGYVVFTGVQESVSPCSVGGFGSDAGLGVFVGEVTPGTSAIIGTRIPGASTAEFSDVSVAAQESVWVTYNTSNGASISQVIRSGSTLSISNTTNSGDYHTLPGDLAFGRDGGFEIVGTVTPPASSFVGVPITPTGGDYDAFILHFLNGSTTDVQTFGNTHTDGFTHVVVPPGQQELVLGMSASYSSTDYIHAFLMALPR